MTQRVLITADAGGNGLAIAKAFVASGARVHIADISKPADLGIRFQDVQKQLGGLDILVNNTGISGATAFVADYPIDIWNCPPQVQWRWLAQRQGFPAASDRQYDLR